jgi:hypothetical protein
MSGAGQEYIRYLLPLRFAVEPGRGQFGRQMKSAVTNHGAGESDHHHQDDFRTHGSSFTCRIAPNVVTIVTGWWSGWGHWDWGMHWATKARQRVIDAYTQA